MMYFSGFLFLVLCLFNPLDANENSSDKTCNLKYGKRLLKEGREVSINGKLYKVEDCKLQRAFHGCGTHLWFMLSIVCDGIKLQKEKDKYRNRIRRFTQEKLLSEACCEHSCTVTEISRYCP